MASSGWKDSEIKESLIEQERWRRGLIDGLVLAGSVLFGIFLVTSMIVACVTDRATLFWN